LSEIVKTIENKNKRKIEYEIYKVKLALHKIQIGISKVNSKLMQPRQRKYYLHYTDQYSEQTNKFASSIVFACK